MTPGCLDGIRVLELARFQAGPRGGMLLSDLGAEVNKIEPPGGEETRRHPPMVRGQTAHFSVYNPATKSHCLDLRTAAGKEVFAALVPKPDLVAKSSIVPKRASSQASSRTFSGSRWALITRTS